MQDHKHTHTHTFSDFNALCSLACCRRASQQRGPLWALSRRIVSGMHHYSKQMLLLLSAALLIHSHRFLYSWRRHFLPQLYIEDARKKYVLFNNSKPQTCTYLLIMLTGWKLSKKCLVWGFKGENGPTYMKNLKYLTNLSLQVFSDLMSLVLTRRKAQRGALRTTQKKNYFQINLSKCWTLA